MKSLDQQAKEQLLKARYEYLKVNNDAIELLSRIKLKYLSSGLDISETAGNVINNLNQENKELRDAIENRTGSTSNKESINWC